MYRGLGQMWDDLGRGWMQIGVRHRISGCVLSCLSKLLFATRYKRLERTVRHFHYFPGRAHELLDHSSNLRRS